VEITLPALTKSDCRVVVPKLWSCTVHLLSFFFSILVQNSNDSEAFTSSVGLPSDALEELEHHKATLPTDSKGHLPTESDQVLALPKADKWPLLGRTKKERVRVVVILWRKMEVIAIKKIQNRLRW
jgi:hypothetical protein